LSQPSYTENKDRIEDEKMRGKVVQILMVLLMVFLMIGCSSEQDKTKKLSDLKFTVLAQEQLPGELLSIVEERKEEPFKLTFTDGDDLYICAGYGKQPTGGYSISVTELYETENAVYAHINLMGPSPGEGNKESPSYPYIVIKLDKTDKTVVFE